MRKELIPVETPEEAKRRIDDAMHLHSLDDAATPEEQRVHGFRFDDGIRLTVVVIENEADWLDLQTPPAICTIVASADAESPAVFGLDPSSQVAAAIFSKLVIQRVNYLLDTNLPVTMLPTDFIPPHMFMWRIWAEPRNDGSGLYKIPRSDNWCKGTGVRQT